MGYGDMITPKYGPGDCVQIEVDILEAIITKDEKTSSKVIKYKVKPSNINQCLNSMTILEENIQD